MTAERQTSAQARETTAQTGATSSGVQYAKAPSMLWFILPMAALLAYGFLSR
ncbi:MAG: hypothetical protein ABUL62_02240 [Myxococcales bacterium]|jgi:hypothetical protein